MSINYTLENSLVPTMLPTQFCLVAMIIFLANALKRTYDFMLPSGCEFITVRQFQQVSYTKLGYGWERKQGIRLFTGCKYSTIPKYKYKFCINMCFTYLQSCEGKF